METDVLIIGGGATGTALARDLALRGVHCVLAEKDDINAGASGRNHGLLHSGARYVSNDAEAAVECREEGAILKRLAPQCIQDTGGLFVAVEGDDERYVADFPGHCERCGIDVQELDVAEARRLEPALSERAIAVYQVPDASVDPFMMSLEFISQAERLGSRLLRKSEVVSFQREGNRIVSATLRESMAGEERVVRPRFVVNAAGAWAKNVAALAGAKIDLLYSKGTLVITHNRLAHRVVNRLRPPSDADILMPGGTVSILGTTSVKVPKLENLEPTVREVDLVIQDAQAMVPALGTSRYVRAYAGVRPLVSTGDAGDGRSVSRGFALIDHAPEGCENFLTITGGKLTTCRLMAEKTADAVCERLGVTAPCLTATDPLPIAPEASWTEPGMSPKQWIRQHEPGDALVCECEMVAKSAIDTIVHSIRERGERPTLTDIGLRSRVGKGACQGSFCAVRTVAHLYDVGESRGSEGVHDLIEFQRERWRGERAILWGEQLAQAELTEAIHCGLFGQELRTGEKR